MNLPKDIQIYLNPAEALFITVVRGGAQKPHCQALGGAEVGKQKKG